MTKAESPRTLYELLATRFPTPLAVVIYDNACNVCAYAMNRVPAHFRFTQWLSDGMHYKAHKNCAPTFDSCRHGKLFDGASVVYEQKNRDLARLKKNVPHMLYVTFAALLLWTVSRLNFNEFGKMKRKMDGIDGMGRSEPGVEGQTHSRSRSHSDNDDSNEDSDFDLEFMLVSDEEDYASDMN